MLSSNRVVQIQQRMDEDEEAYEDQLDECPLKCSSVCLDYMLVNPYAQDLLLTTRDMVNKAFYRMTVDQRTSQCNVVRLAQAEGQTL